jgi:uncharacterized protein (TIGR02453 family)
MTRLPAFPGFPRNARRFLAALAKNNRRDWFQAHKAEFERDVRQPMEALVQGLNEGLRAIAPDYVTPPKSSIFRMNRDVRFSKDKSPYKTQVAAHFPYRGGAPDAVAGFYVALSAAGMKAGGGAYMPGPPALARLRAHVAEEGDAFRRLTSGPALRRDWGALDTAPLKGMPRGWKSDHPEAGLLRLTRAFYMVDLPVDLVTAPDLLPELVRRWRALTPFVQHVDAVLAGRRVPARA